MGIDFGCLGSKIPDPTHPYCICIFVSLCNGAYSTVLLIDIFLQIQGDEFEISKMADFKKKDLYLGKSMKDLNNLADKKNNEVGRIKEGQCRL